MRDMLAVLEQALPNVIDYTVRMCGSVEEEGFFGAMALHRPALEEELRELGSTFLGWGNYAVVFTCPWDASKVIKFSIGDNHVGDLSDPWIGFAQVAAEYDHMPLMPQIDWLMVHPAGVAVALCDMLSELHRYEDIDAVDELNEAVLFGYGAHRVADFHPVSQLEFEAMAVGEVLHTHGLPLVNDVCQSNVMLDLDGNFVLNDPIGGELVYKEDCTWIGWDGRRRYPSEAVTVCGAAVKIAPRLSHTEVKATGRIASVAALATSSRMELDLLLRLLRPSRISEKSKAEQRLKSLPMPSR